MGSTQSCSIATLDTLSHQNKDSLNFQFELWERQIKSTKINAIKTIGFTEIVKICKNPEFSLSVKIIPSLRFILNSDNQNLIFDVLNILSQLIKSNKPSIEFIVHNGVLQDIFKLCSHSSEKIIGISINFLFEIIEISEDARIAIYFSGVIEPLSKLIAHENLTIRSTAIDIINKLYFNEEFSLGKIINSEIFGDLVVMAKSNYWIDKFSIATIFSKIIGDISDEKTQMGIIDSLLEALGSESLFLINSSLVCLAYTLELGKKNQLNNPYQSACKASRYFSHLKKIAESNSFAKMIWNCYFSNKNDLKVQIQEKVLIQPIIIEMNSEEKLAVFTGTQNNNFLLDNKISDESNTNAENCHNLAKYKVDELTSIDLSSSQDETSSQKCEEKINQKSNKNYKAFKNYSYFTLKSSKLKSIKKRSTISKKVETKEKEIQTNDYSESNSCENQENISIIGLKNKKEIKLTIQKSPNGIEIVPSFDKIKITLIRPEQIDKKIIPQSKQSSLQNSVDKASEIQNISSLSGVFSSQIPAKPQCNKENPVKEVNTKQQTVYNQPQLQNAYKTFNDLDINSSFSELSDDLSVDYSFIGTPNAKVEDIPDWAYTFTGSATRKWNGNLDGRKKQNGTPDMRCAENYKSEYTKKSQCNYTTLNDANTEKLPVWASTFKGSDKKKWNGNLHGRKKKDGTPDMRCKENYA